MVLLILWHGTGLFQSCNPCGSDGPIFYTISSLSSNLIRVTEKEDVAGFSSSINLPIVSHEIVETNDNFIAFDSLGIDIFLELSGISLESELSTGNIYHTAFACSPAEDYDLMKDDFCLTAKESIGKMIEESEK